MADTRPVARPLSPHLQIYRMTITMFMSIVHRITGAALYFGTALLAWWLIAAATGPEAYATFASLAGSWFGQLVLVGYAWALTYHLFSGIRYLVWDTGRGMAPKQADIASWIALLASFAATAAIVVAAYSIRGVL